MKFPETKKFSLNSKRTKFCLQKQTNETEHIVSRNKETQSLKKQYIMYGGTKNMKQNMAVNTSQ